MVDGIVSTLLNTGVRVDELVNLTWAEGPSLCGKRGPYTDRGIRNLLAILGRRADVPHVHPHRFRHGAARRLVEVVNLPTPAAVTVRIYALTNEVHLSAQWRLESR